MRFLLPLILTFAATTAQADDGFDTYFKTGGCFVRDYTATHLADHPQQQVRYIALSPSLLPELENIRVLNVFVALRDNDYYYHAVANCAADGQHLHCQMDGDAGTFTLEPARKGGLRLTVGPNDMEFKGNAPSVSLQANSGDDRVFLLPNVDASICN